MSKQEIYDFLKGLDVCDTCVLRYLDTQCDQFENIEQAFESVRIIQNSLAKWNSPLTALILFVPIFRFQKGIKSVQATTPINGECEDGITKRPKPNICVACLGIFQNDFIRQAADEIIEKSNLSTYECATVYTSITMPVSLQVRELSLWIGLLKQFSDSMSEGEFSLSPNSKLIEPEIIHNLENLRILRFSYGNHNVIGCRLFRSQRPRQMSQLRTRSST